MAALQLDSAYICVCVSDSGCAGGRKVVWSTVQILETRILRFLQIVDVLDVLDVLMRWNSRSCLIVPAYLIVLRILCAW